MSDIDTGPELPLFTLDNPAIVIPAETSVPLEITMTATDSDDNLLLRLSGLPAYETITAPAGDTVTKAFNGVSYTWTIKAPLGQDIQDLVISSNYTGATDKVIPITITEGNTTAGENGGLTISHVLSMTAQHEQAEIPALTIDNTAISVSPGTPVPLGITATPIDSDDKVQVKISGVPSFESIVAPTGDTVSKVWSGSSYTWTVSAPAGHAVQDLMLKSSYTGAGHPVSTFVVIGINKAAVEAAFSSFQTIQVTDPEHHAPIVGIHNVGGHHHDHLG